VFQQDFVHVDGTLFYDDNVLVKAIERGQGTSYQ
jgi:hypothetical protein